MAINNSIYFQEMPKCILWIQHAEEIKAFILPSYPDSIQDSMGSTFQQTNALSRSAPIFTYSYSGPREVEVSLVLHRDMMDDVNKDNPTITDLSPGEGYLEALIRAIQSIAVPKYNLENKLVQPPMVYVKLGEEVFIRGVVTGGVTVTYEKPILVNNRYAKVTFAFKVYETDPYDAATIADQGSFRGLTKPLISKMGLEEE